MDGDELHRRLDRAFDAPRGERRVVVRQALDLAAAGRWAETHEGDALTAEYVVDQLDLAPEGEGLADRWNWWIGSLELAYGGFEPFAIRRWGTE